MMRLKRSLAAVLFAVILAGSGAAQGVADLVERARPAVAIVVARTGGSLSQGSGFVYDARGFLLTAAHAVEGAGEVTVRLPNRRPMLAVVAQTSRSIDVAALRVGEEGLPFIPLAAGRPRVGEEIVVLGYPRADVIGFDDLTVTRGIVSRVLVDQGLLQFDASVNPGNSGGPVLNNRGEAVGIVVGGIRGATGINFAVLSEAARDVARLALQVPFAPTTPPVVQVQPSPGPSPAPSPAVPPVPGEWRLIGTKGPTPRNTEIRTPVNLAIREARYRMDGGVLYVQTELYERPTGDARISVLRRLPGSQTPRWVLLYYPASGRVVFGRYVVVDEVRRLWRVDPVSVSGVRVSMTGSFIDVSVPLAALQPDSPEWEIEVATAYLAPDNIYRWVDWLPWTRIRL
jgi:putative serine protease PepD